MCPPTSAAKRQTGVTEDDPEEASPVVGPSVCRRSRAFGTHGRIERAAKRYEGLLVKGFFCGYKNEME
jgi:hypothetical protein